MIRKFMEFIRQIAADWNDAQAPFMTDADMIDAPAEWLAAPAKPKSKTDIAEEPRA